MKRQKHFLLLVVTLCLAASLFSSSVADAHGNAAVSLTAPRKVAEGSTFIASVNIGTAADLHAANYDIIFDPNILEVTDATNGLIAGTTMPVDIWREITPGTIRLIDILPALSGVSGSGYLAKIKFRVIGSAGSMSYIKLSNGVLSNTFADEIPATWAPTSVRVYKR
jgi:hypothetical protein